MVDLKKVRIENIMPETKGDGAVIDVLRLDLMHPIISGNKWFKLRYFLEEAKQQNKNGILTFGGAWSNHILATAYACKQEGFDCTLVIRGEKPVQVSHTLRRVEELGAEIIYVARNEYREMKRTGVLRKPDYLVIPEGGYGEAGVRGASTIGEFFAGKNYSHIICAGGTGTMAAGLLRNLDQHQSLIVVSVLKGFTTLEEEIKQQAGPSEGHLEVNHDFHFGGYAVAKPPLISYMNKFYSDTRIPTDFVYTGKLFFGLDQLIREGFFPARSRVLAIHSGGIQGNESLEKGTLIF
jgi:1-aminocyclopropane-1-carboxylate deaminase/D-cysteine desulfhydrase-like pyridoxal-dependent ACC family enzyme